MMLTLTWPAITHGDIVNYLVFSSNPQYRHSYCSQKSRLWMIKRFCCYGPQPLTPLFSVLIKHSTLDSYTSPWGVFSNLEVTCRDTGDHLIFTGPTFLHGNSDFSSYHSFFAHLSTKLRGTTSPPIFGTDDEIALKQAIRAVFPDATLVSCT